jgi:UDP-N-acetylglucosamine 2-epimerase (non-hydrolysing)
MKTKKLLFVFGTRPEAIKMAPVVREAFLHPDALEVKICITGQHREMLRQVMDFFQLKADHDLALMQPNQTLSDLTANALKALEKVLELESPDLILVQGDTTTAMTGALAGYYRKIPVAHIEAGLRSGDIHSPFPEEVNRKIISTLCRFHFAPTPLAVENLQRENYTEHVYQTGNTVIDALLWGVEQVRDNETIAGKFPFLAEGQRMVLITAHRRESFGQPFESICSALASLADSYPDHAFVYPVHLNPNVQEVVYRTLANRPNIFLIPPVGYPELLWLLYRSHLVLTDSGGIQEEAPTLGKPVLVMRDVTERQEGITAGTALLVGTDKEQIIKAASRLLNDEQAYADMAQAVNPYGDGSSAAKIISTILTAL